VRLSKLILCGILLASCSRTGGNAFVPTTAQGGGPSAIHTIGERSGYKLLYAFAGAPDGNNAPGQLTALNGKLYGLTVLGGSAGLGTVFEMSKSGTEQVLYSFKGGADGSYPGASLLAKNGVLYGTTEGGGGGTCGSGGAGCGTVFEVTPSGSETVLYAFKGIDGSTPIATPVMINGKLYGTTQSGGGTACLSGLGCGTVFELSKTGKERVLHAFSGGADGGNPYSGLTALSGTLYGTTFEGGKVGFGAVYKISTSGDESVVYSFQSNGKDGENPYAGVIALNEKLYGTTQEGGADGRHGTVYEVTTAGKEHVLHSFTAGADGSYPYGALLAVNGALYGTTAGGGLNYVDCVGGCGTVFKVTMSGAKTLLYSFGGGPDGGVPNGAMILVNGLLYGMTVIGGTGHVGTVFRILP
jgi:uncharacterized repeat protein (TIGR03803 family)